LEVERVLVLPRDVRAPGHTHESKSAYQKRQVDTLSAGRRANGGVAPSTENERRAHLLGSIQLQNPSDHDPMVAALLDRLDGTSECCGTLLPAGGTGPGPEREPRRLRLLPCAGEIR